MFLANNKCITFHLNHYFHQIQVYLTNVLYHNNCRCAIQNKAITALNFDKTLCSIKNMSLYEKIVNKEEKISLVGLGYVGMPIAVAFARKVNVIGYDLNTAKIDLYKNGIDPTNEVGDEVIKNTTVEFTSDENKLKEINDIKLLQAINKQVEELGWK